ncbi:MAG: class IV adenylate cyclase [Caldisphaeraceae archaeon]|nr:class IV adenylate cyclase [Caldisphaeraceae archaeon]
MDKTEVEVKIEVACNSMEEIETKLKELNATFLEERREEDIYLGHPCKDMKAMDEALRIRFVNGKPRSLTYKSKKQKGAGGIKAREEVTINLKENPLLLLKKLGFNPSVNVRKLRKYYDFDNVIISLDDVDELGCYVEVESKNGSDVEVAESLKKLNIKGKVIESTYADMVWEKLRGKDDA